MWPFRRKADDDELSYESYSSYEEYTDDEFEEDEKQKVVHDGDVETVEPTDEETEVKEQSEEPKGVPREEETKEVSKEEAKDSSETDSDDELVIVQPVAEDDDSKSIENDAGLSFSTDGSVDTTKDDDDDDDESVSDASPGEEQELDVSDDEEEEEDPSSLAEKHSLLALAAEHDRVDILKAILSENAQEQSILLNAPIPPLHVAVCYGSTHATSCLLRMGANPAIRPNVAEIQKGGEKHLVEMAHLASYDDVSAWELAFGRTVQETEIVENEEHHKNDSNETEDTSKSAETKKGWFGVFGGSSSKIAEEKDPIKGAVEDVTTISSTSEFRRPTVKPVDMAPSKREGIRHAFMAEALRCIGADEVHRLQQLLDAGMPSDVDVGGKTLHAWCAEMEALQCEELIRPPAKEQEEKAEGADEYADEEEKEQNEEKSEEPAGTTLPSESGPTAVDRDRESLASLANNLEELESLSTALSTCLDNLAEEVSVCHGLLLSGGGAAALASHVRSLKSLRASRQDELEHWTGEWEKSDKELAHWIVQYGGIEKYADDFPLTNMTNVEMRRRNKLPKPQNMEEEEAQRRQLLAQLAASENKIRKLRASITDLSEENTRDLEEVERRSLTGGVKLVRSLRDELREVEFKLSQAKSGEAACRAHISMIQSRLETRKKTEDAAAKKDIVNHKDKPTNTRASAVDDRGVEKEPVEEQNSAETSESRGLSSLEEAPEKRQSEVIASGDSNAITVHQPHGHGYLPIDLWDILLRIIGMGREAVKKSAENIRGESSNVMIV